MLDKAINFKEQEDQSGVKIHQILLTKCCNLLSEFISSHNPDVKANFNEFKVTGTPVDVNKYYDEFNKANMAFKQSGEDATSIQVFLVLSRQKN